VAQGFAPLPPGVAAVKQRDGPGSGEGIGIFGIHGRKYGKNLAAPAALANAVSPERPQ
jgi:hypothetical protein